MPRIFSPIDSYINSLFAQEDPLLQAISADLSEGELAMQLCPHEGKLVSLLLKLIGAKSAIEIGTLAGYSATWIARALGEEGKLYCFERSKLSIDRFKRKLEDSDLISRIEFILGDAKDTLNTFQHTVDAIFIDADKASYPLYLSHAKRLLRSGGLLLADNVFLFGATYGNPYKKVSAQAQENISLFNQAIASSEDFEATIIPTQEGLLIAKRK